MWNLESRLYHEGEPVRSNSCGLGEVTVSGTKPVVRFLNGLELIVLDDEIRPISDDDYDRELINECIIETWLDWRILGRKLMQRKSPSRLRLDTATALADSMLVGLVDSPCVS